MAKRLDAYLVYTLQAHIPSEHTDSTVSNNHWLSNMFFFSVGKHRLKLQWQQEPLQMKPALFVQKLEEPKGLYNSGNTLLTYFADVRRLSWYLRFTWTRKWVNCLLICIHERRTWRVCVHNRNCFSLMLLLTHVLLESIRAVWSLEFFFEYEEKKGCNHISHSISSSPHPFSLVLFYMLDALCVNSFVAGIISRERLSMFERMLWRVCRGNVYMRSSEIEAPLADPIYPEDAEYKTAFIIFFQGDQLKTRVRKICEGYVDKHRFTEVSHSLNIFLRTSNQDFVVIFLLFLRFLMAVLFDTENSSWQKREWGQLIVDLSCQSFLAK